MVNHVRTHLLNIKPQAIASAVGEEYISPTFSPRLLTTDAKRVHRMLFGSNPDRTFLNYRCRQLMRLLHASELHEHTLLVDPRITYLPFSDTDDAFESLYGVVITPIMPNAKLVTLQGTYTPPSGSGQLTQVWQVDVTASSVEVQQRRNPYMTESFELADLTTGITLPGSDLKLRFPEGGTTGDRWDISYTAAPPDDLASILPAVAGSLGGLVDKLFPARAEEPHASWTNIWRTQPNGPLRYSAMLIALSDYISKQPQVVYG